MSTILLEQQLFQQYQLALSVAVAGYDARDVDNAYQAWDCWMSVAFPDPHDRVSIGDPVLLGRRRGVA
jgi:hypothetical protein